jgi:hypothetical protein
MDHTPFPRYDAITNHTNGLSLPEFPCEFPAVFVVSLLNLFPDQSGPGVVALALGPVGVSEAGGIGIGVSKYRIEQPSFVLRELGEDGRPECVRVVEICRAGCSIRG